jgi:hypothetical protein
MALLPLGVKHGLMIPLDQIVMQALVEYDTEATMGYQTTLALFWIPNDQFTNLYNAIHTPSSSLYKGYSKKQANVRTLMSLINTAFPLEAGQGPDGGASFNPLPTPTSGPGDSSGDPFGSDSANSSPVNASSVGIVLASIGGASAYGAAMLYVARRYRKKRLRHQRSSSIGSHRQSGSLNYGAWMAGANGGGFSSFDARASHGSGSSNGRSIRTQQISAPVMSENSLGWN